VRSLLCLKALIYQPTGGMVAAPTTSLPERIGGKRNWDYRYCWVRDATYTLYTLVLTGYREEAAAWVDWLVRALAGTPSQVNIMYGLAGERRLPELELEHLRGRRVRPRHRAERLQHRRRDERRVADRREVDEEHAVAEVLRRGSRELEREPRLADPAGAGDRQHAHVVVAEERFRRRKLVRAPDERRRRHRQVSGPPVAPTQGVVLREDRALQIAQRRPRLEPELVDEHAAGFAKRLERLGLTPRAVQREHELRPQPLAERMLRDERLELAHELVVPSELQLELDARLERR
jgi:hypothetical protein